jgi:hypothetical protein
LIRVIALVTGVMVNRFLAGAESYFVAWSQPLQNVYIHDVIFFTVGVAKLMIECLGLVDVIERQFPLP